MRTGKRILGMTGILCVALWVIFSANVFAQEESSTGSNAAIAGENEAKSTKDWKQEISSDVRDIKQDRETNRSHAQAAIKEEKDLRDQMHQAVQSGDHEKAQSLREQLKSQHRENVREKQQDMRNLRESRQELRSDMKDARRDGALPPGRINPPGAGPGNPPGVGPHRLPPRRVEDVRDRRKDRDGDRRDFRDPGKDRRDGRRGDRDHRRGGDDGRRYFSDSRGDGQGGRGDAGQNSGVRDHGAGVGAGKGQGGMHRDEHSRSNNGGGPRGGRGR